MQEKSRLWRTSVGVLSVLTIVAVHGLALDPHQPANSYLRTDFTIEDGLPDNKVNAITQTRNGFLWVGTDGGLARFDGEHFTKIHFRGGVSREIPVNYLLTAPGGELWVGTDAGLVNIPGGVQDHFDRSLVTLYHPGVALSDQVMCLHLRRDGTLLVGTNRGLYRLDHGKLVSVIPEEMISAVEEASDGHLLIVTGRGFVEWDGSRIIRYPELPGQLGVHSDEIYHVFEDRNGVRWLCTSGGLARRVNGSIQKITPYGRSPLGPAYRVYEDPQGTVWTNKQSGLSRVGPTALEPVEPGLHARCMFSDMDGDLWIGTGGDGLLRFKDHMIRMYTTADGLGGNFAMTVLSSHDGTLWVGNNCGGLSRFDGQRFRTYDEKDGMANSCVWSMAEDASHDLWVGTWGGGINRFRNGRFTSYSTAEGLPSNVALSVVAARDGSLWIATPEGVSHMQNGHFRNYTMSDGLSSDRIVTVYQDRNGGIWAGTSVGIDHLVGDRFVPVQPGPESDNIPYGPFREDSLGNLYALSLINGISRIENNRMVNVNQALEPSGMLESSGHDFWLSGRHGILRIAAADLKREELDRDSPPDYALFGRADGLNSQECSSGQPNMAITPDGKLWVGTVKGLAMLDLQRLPHRNRKPAIFMEEVEVGRTKRTPGRDLVLGPGTYHVELHFTAVDLASPENIRIQYRLDGVDPVWLDADSTRTAIYTNIPVGVHSFHIRASNGDGVWDREGIVYNINQQPFFYQTGAFRLAAVIAGLLVVVGLYRLRFRQAATRLSARFDERMAERNRLAGELHDTILQTVQATKMIADNARYDHAGDPARLREAMESISDWLAQATAEARAALNALRTSTTQKNDLAEAFQRAAESSGITSSMRFVVSVEGAVHELHPIVRDEIYRIGGEAIRNAYLHSGATQLEVNLRYAQNLTVRIRDNGKGIDPDIAISGKPGHFGLQGMQERAARVRGTLRVLSRPGSGTEIELIVPGRMVFRETFPGRQNLYGKLRRFFWRALSPKEPDTTTKKEKII